MGTETGCGLLHQIMCLAFFFTVVLIGKHKNVTYLFRNQFSTLATQHCQLSYDKIVCGWLFV